MSEGIIYLFEMIKIEHHNRKSSLITTRTLHLGFKQLHEITTIVDTGKLICAGYFLKLLHGFVQLPYHSIERLGKFSHKFNSLSKVSRSDHAGLPGKVPQR